MPTRNAATAFGNVDYDTVECTSCENEVIKDDAKKFLIGDVCRRKYWSHKRAYEFTIERHGLAEGWVCEYCLEDPVVFPVPILMNVPQWMVLFGLVFSLTIAFLMGGIIL